MWVLIGREKMHVLLFKNSSKLLEMWRVTKSVCFIFSGMTRGKACDPGGEKMTRTHCTKWWETLAFEVLLPFTLQINVSSSRRYFLTVTGLTAISSSSVEQASWFKLRTCWQLSKTLLLLHCKSPGIFFFFRPSTRGIILGNLGAQPLHMLLSVLLLR